MKISISNAAKMANKSRTTIYSDINSGALSTTRSSKGKVEIDVAELERVYGTLRTDEQAQASSNVKGEQDRTERGTGNEAKEQGALRELLDRVDVERARERKQLEDQIEYLQGELDKEKDERRKVTAILTDQRSAEDKQAEKHAQEKQRIDSMNERIEGLKQEHIEDLALLKRQNRQIMYELRESNRGFWSKFFGEKRPGGQGGKNKPPTKQRAV